MLQTDFMEVTEENLCIAYILDTTSKYSVFNLMFNLHNDKFSYMVESFQHV